MERKTLKIEIPLPRLPSRRAFRFSLQAFLLTVTAFALACGIYRYATEAERSKHRVLTFEVIVSTPDSSERSTRPIIEGQTLVEVLETVKQREYRHLAILDRPPRVWIKRIDFDVADFEKQIEINCSAMLENLEIPKNYVLRYGDRIFVDCGRLPSSKDALRDVARMHGVTLSEASIDDTNHDQAK